MTSFRTRTTFETKLAYSGRDLVDVTKMIADDFKNSHPAVVSVSVTAPEACDLRVELVIRAGSFGEANELVESFAGTLIGTIREDANLQLEERDLELVTA